MEKHIPTDQEVLDAFLIDGLGLSATAKKFGVAMNTIYQRKEKLIKNGLLDKDFAKDRQIKEKISDDELINCYLNKGWGIYKISKEYNMAQERIRRRIKKLGILDSSKQMKNSNLPRRKRRKSSDEFSEGLKKERFFEEKGICEYCHKLIHPTNWRLATYHHKKPLKFGGDASKANCMVLHGECHREHFYELHGFEYPYKNLEEDEDFIS